MRQKFSYIICMIFMLFGMSSMIHGAAAVLGDAARVAESSLEGSLKEAFTKAGMGAADDMIRGAAATIKTTLKEQMTALQESILKGAGPEAMQSVEKSMQEDLVARISSVSGEDRVLLRQGKEATPTFTRTIGAAASDNVEKILRNLGDLKPTDANFATKFQEESDVLATLNAKAAQGEGLTASQIEKIKPVVKPFQTTPEWILDGTVQYAKGAASAISNTKIVKGMATAADFVAQSPVGKVAGKVGGGVKFAGKCALGSPIIDIETSVEKRALAGAETTLKDLKKSPDYPSADRSLITEDTIFDRSTGKPIENPEPRPAGLGKYAKASDPAYPRNADGSFKYKEGQVQELDPKTQEPLLDPKTGKPRMVKGNIFEQPKTTTKKVPRIGADGRPEVYSMKNIFGNSAGVKLLGSLLKKISNGIEMITVQGMVMGMAMSVPNSLMAGFTAERMLQAQLATLSAPVRFGGVVMQIPDEVINSTAPANSVKIYAGIPVASTTSVIGGGGANPSPTNMVVGPSLDNNISRKIADLAKDQFKAFMSSLMSAANEMETAGSASQIPRYTFFQGDSTNASYYDSAHLFCSWSSQSWTPWASTAITDPGFTGFMIDLNTGYVFASDGTTQGNAPVALLGTGANGASSIENFLSTEASNLNAQNLTFDFAQYTSGGQPDVDAHVGGALMRQFSSACLSNKLTDKPAGAAGSGFGDICMVGNFRNSLLATSLMRLAAGVCIDQNGKEIILAPTASVDSSGQYVDPNAELEATLNSAISNAGTAIGKGIRSGVNTLVKKAVDTVKPQLLAPTAVKTAAKVASTKSADAALAAQVAAFYQDSTQKFNFAMQSAYASDQITFADSIYSKLTQEQKNNFATFALAQATSDQQQEFMDIVYNGLASSAKSSFEQQLKTFKDSISEMQFVFSQASAAQQKTFLDTVFNALTPMQIRAFIQNPQFVTASQLQTFVNGIYDNADEYDRATFAENALAVGTQVQAQQQASKNGASGAAAYQVLQGSDSNQILQAAIAQGALGGVVPIYGFDTNFQDFINTHFAKAYAQLQVNGNLQVKTFGHQTVLSQKQHLASGSMQSGATVGNDSTETRSSNIQGGANLNYPALGVYIYECENTPFASQLTNLTSTQALDYIVFFDANLNCVPLQVVAPDSNSGGFYIPTWKLNPAIKYWASLICYLGNGSGPLDEFMGRYQDPSGVVQTFFPLYTMFGDLAYVQGASNAMDNVISDLQKPNPNIPANVNIEDLYNQIVIVAKLESATYQYGPFYKPYKLVEADSRKWMSEASTTGGNPIEVIPYIGMPPYPMTLNLGATSGPTDYLIPFVKEGGQSITVPLPSPYVEMFVSLVTDITFKTNFDEVTGMTSFVPISYVDSPYNPNTGLDSTKTSTYTWLNRFKSAGVTIPQALIDDVHSQRDAWIKFINSNKNDPTFKVQVHGFPFGQKYTLTLANSDDYENSFYLYTCLSSPSGIADDLYVMSATAALPNATVGAIADVAKLQLYVVSLATGFMYDNTGKVVKNSAGKPVSMDPNQLLGLVEKNNKIGKPLSTASQAHLKQIIAEGQKILNAVQGPYEFGDLILHLYEVDIENGNYVYFTLNNLGKPSDYFVVVKSTKQPFVFGGPIDGATQNMVSLISGQLYTRTGVVGTWPNLDTLLSAVTSTMSISAADLVQINKLNAAFKSQQSAETLEKNAAAQKAADAKAQVVEDIGNIAANIVAKLPNSYLPAPYDSLVKDTSGKYYRVTPGADGKPFMIFDFNATSASADSGIGAMFMADGTFVTIMDGIHLVEMRQQFGVQVDSKTGAQSLTVPHICGNMNLSAADQKIVPGNSGTALLIATDPQFPTPGIPAKMSNGTQTYYFYYHTFLHSYFVYVVDSASKEAYYVSLNDGTAYNPDGSARIVHYQVARGTKGDPMIITQDANGYLSTTFADPGTSSKSTPGKYINFISDPNQFIVVEDDSYRAKQGMYGINYTYGMVAPHTPVLLYQDFPEQYGYMTFNPNAQVYLAHYEDGTVYEVYTVEATSQVQALAYLPISSKTGQIITAPVSALLQTADFILKQGEISEVIFNGIWYKAGTGGTFTSSAGGSITVKTFPATQNCAAYAIISQGANDYTYSYAYQTLSDDDFTQYKQVIWQMDAGMNPTGKAVLCKNFNPAAGKSVAVVKDTATSAVPYNVKNVPDSLVSGVTINVKNIKFDQVTGKYFAPIAAADYDYFGQDGYVDIENGCFYDAKGIPYGYSLVLQDYVALLNKLNVMVVYNVNSKRYDIVFRSGQLVKQEAGITSVVKSTAKKTVKK